MGPLNNFPNPPGLPQGNATNPIFDPFINLQIQLDQLKLLIPLLFLFILKPFRFHGSTTELSPMNLRNFNLNLLVVFETIWIHRNLSRAADLLHMTQPGVSTALNRLRIAFGDPLFKWNGLAMAPTPRARELAPQIHTLLSEMERVVNGQSSDISTSTREFTIASVDWVFADLGNRLLLRVRNQAPGVRLRMEHLSLSMLENEDRFELDVIIAPDIEQFNPNLEKLKIYDDTFVGISSANNMLVGKRPGPKKFAALPKIYINSSGMGISRHRAVSVRNNTTPGDQVLATYSYLTIPFLLQQSDCIAVVPRRLAQTLSASTDIHIFSLPESTLPLPIYLYWPSRLTKDLPHTWFRQQLIEAAHAE